MDLGLHSYSLKRCLRTWKAPGSLRVPAQAYRMACLTPAKRRGPIRGVLLSAGRDRIRCRIVRIGPFVRTGGEHSARFGVSVGEADVVLTVEGADDVRVR